MLIGGVDENRVPSKGIHIFDSSDSSWKEQDPLPEEFIGEGEGLYHHAAHELRSDTGLEVICLGGDLGNGKNSSNVLIYSIE